MDKRNIFGIIWDHLAPLKAEDVDDSAPEGMTPAQPPTPEELKVKRDNEIANMAIEVKYWEDRKKLQDRLDKVAPKSGTFRKSDAVTLDKNGKPVSGSLAARIWRRIPLKPVVLPIGLVLIIVLIYARAC